MNELLNEIVEYLKISKEFIIEQAPDLIIQTLKYKTYSCYFSIIFFSILFMCSSFSFYYFINHPVYEELRSYQTIPDISAKTFMGRIMSGFILFLSFISLLTCADQLVKIKISPKYFLIELFMEKKNKIS